MKKALLRNFKRVCTVVGARLPAPRLHGLQMVLNYMKLGAWMKKHGFRLPHRVVDREAVFGAVAELVGDEPVLYLEFGVYRGESMRFWSSALRHPRTKLHGFDSFEGLPEDFDVEGPHVKGTFDVRGNVPVIDDRRVTFFKGWFDEVLPGYEVPEHDRLVVVMDADLYSSTVCVLNKLRPHIKEGTLIYFDNMSRPEHEPRAFGEFMRESGLRFEAVSADQSLNCVFFRCLG